MAKFTFETESSYLRVRSTEVSLNGTPHQYHAHMREIVEVELSDEEISKFTARDLRRVGITTGTMNFNEDNPPAKDWYAIVPGHGTMSIEEAVEMVKNGKYTGYVTPFTKKDSRVCDDYAQAYVEVLQKKSNHLQQTKDGYVADGKVYIVSRQAVLLRSDNADEYGFYEYQAVPFKQEIVRFDGYWSVAIYKFENGIIAELVDNQVIRPQVFMSDEVGLE